MTIGAFVCGNGLGWTSPALPGIQDIRQITHIVDDYEAKLWADIHGLTYCETSAMTGTGREI